MRLHDGNGKPASGIRKLGGLPVCVSAMRVTSRQLFPARPDSAEQFSPVAARKRFSRNLSSWLGAGPNQSFQFHWPGLQVSATRVREIFRLIMGRKFIVSAHAVRYAGKRGGIGGGFVVCDYRDILVVLTF